MSKSNIRTVGQRNKLIEEIKELIEVYVKSGNTSVSRYLQTDVVLCTIIIYS